MAIGQPWNFDVLPVNNFFLHIHILWNILDFQDVMTSTKNKWWSFQSKEDCTQRSLQIENDTWKIALWVDQNKKLLPNFHKCASAALSISLINMNDVIYGVRWINLSTYNFYQKSSMYYWCIMLFDIWLWIQFKKMCNPSKLLPLNPHIFDQE